MSYINLPILSGMPIPVSLGGVSGRLTINFSGAPMLYTATITGGTIISGVNYTPSTAVEIRLNVSGASAAQVAFPTEWNTSWLSPVPTGIPPINYGLLVLRSFGASDTGVLASWSIQP